MACRLKFIDSFRFMSTSLSSLINNLSDQLYNNCFDRKNFLITWFLKIIRYYLDVLNAKKYQQRF